MVKVLIHSGVFWQILLCCHLSYCHEQQGVLKSKVSARQELTKTLPCELLIYNQDLSSPMCKVGRVANHISLNLE